MTRDHKNKGWNVPFVFIGIAILFLLYGIIIWMTHSGSRFYIVWFCLAFFMLFIGISITNRFPIALKRILLIFLVLFIAFVGVTWSFVLSDFHDHGEPGLDYIVVLGAQIKTTGPSRSLRERLETAYEYLEENPETICVVSGGQGYNEPQPEADAMKDYLVDKGIAEDRILTEPESTNTYENLVYSGQLFTLSSSVGIVTNNFHVYRAVRIASKNGYQDVCGIAAPSNPFYLANNMLRESFGIAKDLLARNM